MTEKKNYHIKKPYVRKKAAALEALANSLGNISAACRAVKVSRNAFYEWLRDDPKFKERVDEINETNLDFAETTLIKNIREGKETSLIFYLKTKGKSRGYIEQVDQNVTINPFLDLMKAATADDVEE